MLAEKMHQVAHAGRLLETPERAALLFHAAGRGIILTLLDKPSEQRDLRISELARESILRTIAVVPPARPAPSLAAAALGLRALLPQVTRLEPPELQLLEFWLARLSAEPVH